MMPNFQIHYNQGYTVRPVNYDALYEQAFAQIGERTTVTLSTGRVSCQSGMASVLNMTPLFRIKHKPHAATVFDAERFAKELQQSLGSEVLIHEEISRMKLHIERPYVHALREAREADDNFTPYDPIEQHFLWEAKFREDMERFEQQQNRAYQNLLQSALGFEPTEHSDAPPYIPTAPTTKPQPCVDFGFEPTEASE